MKSLSRVRLFATPWTAAYQAPPSMGFSRQEYWSGVPSPSPPFLLGCLFSDKIRSDQIRSVAQSCPTLCDPVDCSMPGFPVHHQPLELAQTHVHPNISSSAISSSSCPQSFPAPGSFLMTQLFPSGGQSIGASATVSVLPVKIQD